MRAGSLVVWKGVAWRRPTAKRWEARGREEDGLDGSIVRQTWQEVGGESCAELLLQMEVKKGGEPKANERSFALRPTSMSRD